MASGPNSHTSTGSSLSAMVSTLIPVLLTAIVVTSLFLYFRRKYDRVYSARGQSSIVPVEHNRIDYTTKGMFGWLPGFRSKPDTFVLNHNSLDGYLFLRFFKVLLVICFIGCCITWPVLFPVNATGGGGQSGLDILSFSNINGGNRIYAHVFISWIFLGFVMLVWAHERLFFIGLRQAYFFTPFHAKRLSSRVVLFLSTPKELLTEAAIRETFGSTVRKVWFAYDCEKLEENVNNRSKLLNKLEGGEMKTILNANKARLKAEKEAAKKGAAQPTPDPEAGNDPYQYVDKKPLTHRLGFLGLFGKKVETIKYGREELPKMSLEIEKTQQERVDGKGDIVTAVFVEFSSQMTAQDAYESVGKRFPKKQMSPRYIGVQPQEVIWKNLKKSSSSRKTLRTLASTFVALLIIFWTIPVAIVGAISNINYLTTKVHFLSFINDIPSAILGVVTGLLPAVMLAVLMALVPIIMRLLAKFAGAATLSQVELQTQKWYFWFQVIQVFLVTTFTSGASSVVSEIIKQPGTAAPLLAKSLPKASNFYICYFLVYGLGQASMQMLAIGSLAMIGFVGPFLDKTPRKQYKRWFNLAGLSWGSVYPLWTNLGVVALAYSIIAPLVLGFAFAGFLLLYIGFRYNWLYVFGNKIDMKGESYPIALHQLLGGVYLSALCLAALMGISKAWGPLALMLVFLVAAAVFQFLVGYALRPLEQISRPSDVKDDMTDADVSRQYAEEGRSTSADERTTIVGEEYEMKAGMTNDTSGPHHANGNRNPNENNAMPEWTAPDGTPTDSTAVDKKNLKGNFLTRRFAPYVHKFYEKAKPMVADCHDDAPEYEPGHIHEAYLNPAIVDETPIIWLAKDPMGLSTQIVLENKESGLHSSDEGAWLNEKNKVQWALEDFEAKVPIYEKNANY